MNRITDKMLETVAGRINQVTNSPTVAWVKNPIGNGNVAQVGHYHIDYTFGGVNLIRMGNVHGGVSCPIGHGSRTKRELFEAMQAFLCGIEVGKAQVAK